MLRPEEMAFLTEQMRKEIKKNRLAGTETKTLVNDGSTPGIDLIGNGILYVRISDDPIDLSTVIDVSVTSGLTTETFSCDFFLFQNNDGLHVLFFEMDGDGEGDEDEAFIISISEDDENIQKGTYVLNLDSQNYISRIRYRELHPIPQEYIPPLDRLILNGADGNQYALTITDGAISVAPVTT